MYSMKYLMKNYYRNVGLVFCICVLLIYTIIYIFKYNQININTFKQNVITQINVKKINQEKNEISILISHLKPELDKILINKITNSVYTEATLNDIPPKLIICYIYKVSGFNVLAKSKYPNVATTVGLMQIEEKDEKSFYIDENIKNGIHLFKQTLNKHKGDIKLTLKELIRKNDSATINYILTLYTESTIIYKKSPD